MSTNKTPRLHMHQWEPNDAFLRTEFNENFSTLDTRVGNHCGIMTGIYTGEGSGSVSSKAIYLGCRPKAVIISYVGLSAIYNSNYTQMHAMAIDGYNENHIGFTNTGFTVGYSPIDTQYGPAINKSGSRYFYIAFV